MKHYWELARDQIDRMTLRERVSIFLAVAFLLIASINVTLLDPLLAKQKKLFAQVVQKQEKMKELQAQLQEQLQAMRDDQNSPLRMRLTQIRQQLQEHEAYLQSRSDRLVDPDKIARLLEQVLKKNDRLHLVELINLPASPLIEKPQAVAPQLQATNLLNVQKQVFKHGIRVTVRGGYLDILHYLAAMEAIPMQIFWGDISLSVEKHPEAVLTLTLYTLSTNKTWLAV